MFVRKFQFSFTLKPQDDSMLGKWLRQSCSGLYPESLEPWKSSRMEIAQPLWTTSSTAWLSSGLKRVSLQNTAFALCKGDSILSINYTEAPAGCIYFHLRPFLLQAEQAWFLRLSSGNTGKVSQTSANLRAPPPFLCWRDPIAYSMQMGT